MIKSAVCCAVAALCLSGTAVATEAAEAAIESVVVGPEVSLQADGAAVVVETRVTCQPGREASVTAIVQQIAGDASVRTGGSSYVLCSGAEQTVFIGVTPGSSRQFRLGPAYVEAGLIYPPCEPSCPYLGWTTQAVSISAIDVPSQASIDQPNVVWVRLGATGRLRTTGKIAVPLDYACAPGYTAVLNLALYQVAGDTRTRYGGYGFQLPCPSSQHTNVVFTPSKGSFHRVPAWVSGALRICPKTDTDPWCIESARHFQAFRTIEVR